jgi:hypothetical protein
LNFETKHVIRWGIPGWVFLLVLIAYLYLDDSQHFTAFKGKDGFSILGLGAILAGSGVPIGYLIHQISMFFGFIIRTKRRRFFKEEYQLDSLFFNHQNGDKLKARFTHLLTRIHELRALKYSILLSGIIIILLEMFSKVPFDLKFFICIGINLSLLLVVHFNQIYFSDNLNYFKKEILKP